MFASFSQNTAYKPSFNRNIRFSLSKNELQDLIKQGLSPKEISQKYNVALPNCYYNMKKWGLKWDKTGKEEKIAEEARKYILKGTRLEEIAEKFNHKISWIRNILEKHEIDSPQNIKIKKIESMVENITQCLNEGMKDKEICNRYKITKDQLSALKTKYELTQPHLSQDIYWKIIPSLLEQGASLDKISKKMGISQKTTELWLRKNLGISVDVIKREQIVELFKQEKSDLEIAEKLNLTYKYVNLLHNKFKCAPENFSQGKRQYIINTIKTEHENGANVEEIAEKLHISPRGVKYYLENFKKGK